MMSFTATLTAADAADAVARAARHVGRLDGYELTGRVQLVSERHLLWSVEVQGDGDANDAWVVLTSYGMTPSESLGSTWQTVELE